MNSLKFIFLYSSKFIICKMWESILLLGSSSSATFMAVILCISREFFDINSLGESELVFVIIRESLQ